MIWKIDENTEVRISALIALVFASSGSISSLILSQFPADQYPSVKVVCLFLAIGGLLASAYQSQNRRMVVNPNEIKVDVKDAKLQIKGEVTNEVQVSESDSSISDSK